MSLLPLLAGASQPATAAVLNTGGREWVASFAVPLTYLVAAAAFIFAMKWLSAPTTARRGVLVGIAGILLAVVGTLLNPHIESYLPLFVAIAIGSAIGVPLALLTPMTALPQQTALSHAFGGLAAGLVGIAKYSIWLTESGLTTFRMAAIGIEVLLGLLTFTGSLMAFGKLQELLPSRPLVLPRQNLITLGVLGLALLSILVLLFAPQQVWLFVLLALLSLAFGVFLVIPIGGADMPTVISLLNSYAGISTAAMGFVLENHLLIVAGALNGSSGFILSVIMCKAMNRSFANVLFGAFGQTQTATAASAERKPVHSATAEEAAAILEGATRVIIVPGYGMAVAQAQHRTRELYDVLTKRGIDVRFAIHPVAGRMPGHMNVLLAEADIPYDKLLEMDDINPDFPQTDVALVIGANDTTNPAARHDKASPIYGMPILDVDKSRTAMVIKRGMSPGFAGIDNELYYNDNTLMLFGDAKQFVGEIVKQLTGGSSH